MTPSVSGRYYGDIATVITWSNQITALAKTILVQLPIRLSNTTTQTMKNSYSEQQIVFF